MNPVFRLEMMDSRLVAYSSTKRCLRYVVSCINWLNTSTLRHLLFMRNKVHQIIFEEIGRVETTMVYKSCSWFTQEFLRQRILSQDFRSVDLKFIEKSCPWAEFFEKLVSMKQSTVIYVFKFRFYFLTRRDETAYSARKLERQLMKPRSLWAILKNGFFWYHSEDQIAWLWRVLVHTILST